MMYLPLQHFQKRCLSVHIIIPCVQNSIYYGPWSESGEKESKSTLKWFIIHLHLIILHESKEKHHVYRSLVQRKREEEVIPRLTELSQLLNKREIDFFVTKLHLETKLCLSPHFDLKVKRLQQFP